MLAELEPQPRYLEDDFERVVGGEVARPNSWPWQVTDLTQKKKRSMEIYCVSVELS